MNDTNILRKQFLLLLRESLFLLMYQIKHVQLRLATWNSKHLEITSVTRIFQTF